MNLFLLMTLIFVIFIIVDLLSAKLLKIKRSILRNISFVSLCVFALISGIVGIIRIEQNNNKTSEILYRAYSYLLEGNIDKASENAQKVQSPHADLILLIVDCRRGNYASAFIQSDDLIADGRLGDGLAAQADRIYVLSRQMTGLEGIPLTEDEMDRELSDITVDCFSELKISEKSEVEFLAGFRRDRMLSSDDFYAVDSEFLSKMLLETPDDKELLLYSVKYYNAVGNLDKAEENAHRLLEQDKTVEHIVLYTDVIAQKLLDSAEIISYDDGDTEIEKLIEKAKNAEETAEQYSQDNPRHDENLIRAAEYRKQAKGIKAKRIINWLIAQTPFFGDHSGVIDLQLSKLYYASGNEEKARELLLELIKRRDKLSDNSVIKQAIGKLGMVYRDNTASDDEISVAISAVLQTNVFLPDSILSRNYSQFLNDLLKYERVSIFISHVDADNYPTVRAYLNVNGRKDGFEELANDFSVSDFTFADNGFEISNKKVTRITDDTNNFISIALVIDGSGSMYGTPIENARRAVEACISNMNPETQELSLVVYDNYADQLVPLTNDAAKLRLGAKQIEADGGTNISSGLLAGIESLKDAVGTKAIILMTDGEDGNPAEMPAAIEAAKANDIAVFTVSTGSGQREYMENIAIATGGSYMEALTDAELVKVYTALQNYIVNNYCFEYTVEEGLETNPRILTIGLTDYEVNSQRMYSYGDLILTKDGSYVMRAESGALQLLYAEPAMISTVDAKLGVPIFVRASGVTKGARVFVNGNEVENVQVVDDMAILFTLNGEYAPGKLDLTVKRTDGISKSTDTLLSVARDTDMEAAGGTVLLGGNGNTLYADYIERRNDYTLKLSGNVILNGFVQASSDVTVQSYSPISFEAGRISLTSGMITSNGAAYTNFSVAGLETSNYGQIAYGSRNVEVLDSFSFYFDEYSITPNSSGVTLKLPGFGEVYADVEFDGSAFVYKIYEYDPLLDLRNNLNYVLNGIPLPQDAWDDVAQLITGHSLQNQNSGYNDNGINVWTQDLTVTIRKGFMGIAGTGRVNGYLGLIEITDGELIIDTDNTDAMFELSGTAEFLGGQSLLAVNRQTPFKLESKGWYPDCLTLNALGLSIHAEDLSECFTKNVLSKAIRADLTVAYSLFISDEPYRGQLSPILPDDISLACDSMEFICSDDWSGNAIKVYHSADLKKYVQLLEDGFIIPIDEVDELSLFGTELGGEIIGTAKINESQIELRITVDGHLDNFYYGVKHDGKAEITIQLPRNASIRNTLVISIAYERKTLTYNASVMGNLCLNNGFATYMEE